MAKGGARLGAGRPRKPLAHHVLAGTYRADRHGPLPAHVHPIGAGTVDAWMPDAGQLAGLGPSGKLFVDRMTEAHTFTAAEGEILIEAGHVVSALAAVRSEPRKGKSLRDVGMLERLELGWSRQFGSLMAQLKVTK